MGHTYRHGASEACLEGFIGGWGTLSTEICEGEKEVLTSFNIVLVNILFQTQE